MKSFAPDIPEFVDCSKMAKLMGLCRSRLYQLIHAGIILHPVYLVANKRPVFTREMAMRNLKVKEQNVGINGQVIMFYSFRRIVSPAPKPKSEPRNERRQKAPVFPQKGRHKDLIEALTALGIEGLNEGQIDSAIHHCFPDGTDAVGEDDILRAVFRYLKRQNPEHNQRT